MYVPQLSHRTNEDMTALHLAVEAGRANVVEALIGLGANVHSKVMVTLCIVRVTVRISIKCRAAPWVRLPSTSPDAWMLPVGRGVSGCS